MTENVLIALLLAALAGLSTALGGLVGVVVPRPSERAMSVALGFSAGVMIWVAFVELFQEGVAAIGSVSAAFALFLGIAVMFLVDVLVPHEYLEERMANSALLAAEPACRGRHRRRHGGPPGWGRRGGTELEVLRCGLLVAVGMGIHNFPEGLATFASTVKDLSLGIGIAVAIAIHNIPEGLAVAAPIYGATGNRRQAFLWSALPGLAELGGAALAALVLSPFLTPALLGWVLSLVAGIMIFISLDELVPVACALGENHLSIVGVTIGMMLMAVTLGLLHG